MVAIRERFIVPDIRRLFYAIAIHLLFLHFEQVIKYSIFTDNVTISRYCWYSYYIPLTLIPYLSLVISLKVDRPVKRMSPFVLFSGVFTVVQIILLMTNDLNGLTFRFKDGDLTNLNDYSRGVLFL
ncbi:MAG: hypothetical protein K6A38_04125 [Lachnospiraceae bacterium]|nr:hypothetical protein [Lachnospiraceae bacterium]